MTSLFYSFFKLKLWNIISRRVSTKNALSQFIFSLRDWNWNIKLSLPFGDFCIIRLGVEFLLMLMGVHAFHVCACLTWSLGPALTWAETFWGPESWYCWYRRYWTNQIWLDKMRCRWKNNLTYFGKSEEMFFYSDKLDIWIFSKWYKTLSNKYWTHCPINIEYCAS